MASGRIAQIGTPEEIYDSPATRYVADFIGSANEVQGQVESTGPDACVVATPVGRLVGRARAGVTRPGQPVVVMFRPEHCAVAASMAGALAGHNRIEGVLERSVFQGATREHVLRAGEHLVVTLVISAEAMAHGTPAVVTVPQDRTWVYALEDAAP